MKLSQVLNRQHIGFMFKRHWLIQGKRVPVDTGLESLLREKGIPVQDALDFIKEPEVRERIQIVGPYEKPVPLDENHPEFKKKPCLTLDNDNVLLEGISQAQVLTKTIIAKNKLPSKIEELAEISAPKTVHEGVKKAILSANVFDCEQKKLPKIKDPVRPAFNFPRILGISDRRRNEIITNRLMQLVEKCNDFELSQSRFVLNDVESKTMFDKEEDLIQFKNISNILVTSEKPLIHDTEECDITFTEIPDLYPVKHTITLPSDHFYSLESIYPIRQTVNKKHPHTTWLHFNSTEVSNIYETPVTEAQIEGRALTHAFTVASAYAKQIHGEEVRDLPEPIFVNCIQTDGQKYHFGVFKLNTLNVDGVDGTKNEWFCKNDLKMYDRSCYFNGMPVLENYDPKVYGYINAFYNC